MSKYFHLKPIKKAAYSYHPDLTNTVIFLFCVGSSLYTVQMSLLEKVQRRDLRWVTSNYDYHQSVTVLQNHNIMVNPTAMKTTLQTVIISQNYSSPH